MHASPVRASAKVIAFPVRAGWDPARAAHTLTGVKAARRARLPKLTPLLLLLAPLLVIGSLLSFVAVVGVFLIWLLIVTVLVVCVIVFAHRLFGRRGLGRPGERPVLRPIDGDRRRSGAA
ncbi:MAG: hypothetical protein ACJ8F2_02235 [Xanthobacteraceae bacterium]